MSMSRQLGICPSCFWTATYIRDKEPILKKCPVDNGRVDLFEVK
jgi:hypothetical protein